MFCGKCGNPIDAGEQFCSMCGNRVSFLQKTEEFVPDVLPDKFEKEGTDSADDGRTKFSLINAFGIGIEIVVVIAIVVFGVKLIKGDFNSLAHQLWPERFGDDSIKVIDPVTKENMADQLQENDYGNFREDIEYEVESADSEWEDYELYWEDDVNSNVEHLLDKQLEDELIREKTGYQEILYTSIEPDVEEGKVFGDVGTGESVYYNGKYTNKDDLFSLSNYCYASIDNWGDLGWKYTFGEIEGVNYLDCGNMNGKTIYYCGSNQIYGYAQNSLSDGNNAMGFTDEENGLYLTFQNMNSLYAEKRYFISDGTKIYIHGSNHDAISHYRLIKEGVVYEGELRITYEDGYESQIHKSGTDWFLDINLVPVNINFFKYISVDIGPGFYDRVIAE